MRPRRALPDVDLFLRENGSSTKFSMNSIQVCYSPCTFGRNFSMNLDNRCTQIHSDIRLPSPTCLRRNSKRCPFSSRTLHSVRPSSRLWGSPLAQTALPLQLETAKRRQTFGCRNRIADSLQKQLTLVEAMFARVKSSTNDQGSLLSNGVQLRTCPC